MMLMYLFIMILYLCLINWIWLWFEFNLWRLKKQINMMNCDWNLVII